MAKQIKNSGSAADAHINADLANDAGRVPRAGTLSIAYRPTAELIPYARNSRTHSDEQVAQIAASIREFGWTNPVLVDEAGTVIAGHGRLLAAQRLKMEQVPTIELAGLSDAKRRALIIADNKLALNAGWDDEMLSLELADLLAEGLDLSLLGFNDDELAALLADDSAAPGLGEGGTGSLADKFMIPPFSVLNAREGWWQDRKRAWLGLGIKSELGRGERDHSAAPGGSVMVSGYSADGQRLTGLKNIGRAI